MDNRTFTIELDDFGFLLPGLDDILRLKEHYPNLKVTLFLIPFPSQFFMTENKEHFKVAKYKEWASVIKQYDWIEVGLHGFFHVLGEYDCKYQKATEMLTAAENMMQELGLPFKKIFRAPFWMYSYDSLNALKDKGYTVCINPEHPISYPEGLRVYKHNWSIEKPLDPSIAEVRGHGHMFDTGRVTNAIGNCYTNIIMSIPENAQFKFVSELINNYEEKNTEEI